MVATALGVAALGAEPAAAAGVRLVIEPVGGTEAPQGESLAYRAVVENRSGRREDRTVALRLVRARDGASIPVRSWPVALAPGEKSAVTGSVVPSQWFADPGTFDLVSETPRASLRLEVTPPAVIPAVFEDATADAGLATRHAATIRCVNHAAGAAWGDVDGDADLDLYLPHQDAPGQLWINDDGRFVQRGAAAGVENRGRAGMSAVFADYDNDGDQDLYVVNDGPNRLYRNDGSGRFHDVSAEAGVSDSGAGASAAWGDYDGDGLLDLYVVNYGRCEDDRVAHADALYRNRGDGTFADVTSLLPRTGWTDGLGLQAAWLDYDADGDQDLYLANDNIGGNFHANVLWRNDGPVPGGWSFTDVSESSGAGMSMNSMGIGISDYDRDGDLDLAVSNMLANVLLRNEGGGRFSERAADAGVARPMQRDGVVSVTWGLAFADLNNDGWEDLYVGAGALGLGDPPEQPNEVFVNAGDGRFLDLSAPSRADDPAMTRGVALADFDRDGRVDVYVVNQTGFPRLYRNTTPTGGRHWLEVDTVGTLSNRDGCGALVVAETDEGSMLRPVLCGSTGLGTGGDPTVHFGLGAATRVRRLSIRWPSGVCQSLEDVPSDRLITVTEPGPRAPAGLPVPQPATAIAAGALTCR